jgi:hypothetical protein
VTALVKVIVSSCGCRRPSPPRPPPPTLQKVFGSPSSTALALLPAASTRAPSLVITRRVEPERARLRRRERDLRLEPVAGHVVEQRLPQRGGDGTLLQIALEVEGTDEQAAGADVRLEDAAEPPVAVPVVNRLHDGLQLAWRAVEVHGSGAAGQLGPLPVAVALGREVRERTVANFAMQSEEAAPAGVHQAIPKDGHAVQRRRIPAEGRLLRGRKRTSRPSARCFSAAAQELVMRMPFAGGVSAGLG